MSLSLAGIALAGLAALLMGFSKTGLPGASIPAVALMTAAFPDDAEASVGAMLPLLLVGDVFAVTWYRRHADWRQLIRLAPYVVLGMVPGYLVLWWLTGNQLRPWLGALVLAMVALELARKGMGWSRLAQRGAFTASAGALAGFSTTVGNAGGPVMSLYLLGRGLLKESFVGTCAWFFFLVNLSKVVPFWLNGMLGPRTLGIGLSLAPVTLGGGLLGLWLLPRIPQAVFNGLMLGLAAASGVWLLVL